MLKEEIPPSKNEQEDKNGNQQSVYELEVVIPNVIDIGNNLLLDLHSFLFILFLEESHNLSVGKRTIELNGWVHGRTDGVAADPHGDGSDNIDMRLSEEIEAVPMGEDDDNKHES